MTATQRIVLHSECLEYIRKETGTLSKIQDEYNVKCNYEDEPNNRALGVYECPVVISSKI
jgi:hypothetical protein